jgi:hypothetical protein
MVAEALCAGKRIKGHLERSGMLMGGKLQPGEVLHVGKVLTHDGGTGLIEEGVNRGDGFPVADEGFGDSAPGPPGDGLRIPE